MASTSPPQRVFALVAALLFFATAVASGAAVIWQINQDNKTSKLAQELTKQQQQTSNVEPLTCEPSNGQQPNPAKEGKLEGTQLDNFTPTPKIEKLTCIDLKVGDGETVNAGATVTAHYTGAVAATGTIFQSSHDSGQPIPFSLNGVIKGWTEGVPGMKVGGVRRLLIPADMAYGANAPSGSGIPANADLVFDIELTAVQQ